MSHPIQDTITVQTVADEIVRWFDTASLDRRRWNENAEIDVWQPVTRIQAAGIGTIETAYRTAYPTGQEVTWSSAVATERGALVEFTVRSRDREHRFAKECAIVETDDVDRIARVRIHCTGEWPATTEQVFLAQGGSLTV